MRYLTDDSTSFEGMDKETILRLRQELGRETVFIDEKKFDEINKKRNEDWETSWKQRLKQ